MQDISEAPNRVERAFLVGLQHPGETHSEPVDHMLAELRELLRTLGIGTVGSMTVDLSRPRPRFLVGSGKARQIIEAARDAKADVIVFDDPLSPAQQRNWENSADITVIDRQEVILDIFAERASTKEAELQIALARSTYELPRLKRRWTHLSRQRGMSGGMGLRGEGEQQIEVDARLVQRRIGRLRKQLEEVRRKREVQRKKRLKRPLPNAAIVGYTNAGKSALLNALTGARVLIEDKLFATLDPTTRRLVLPNQQELLVSDTVGFIRKLPHLLVEAFKATLEEAVLADFIIEVIDATSPDREYHHRTTQEVLRELGAGNKNMITVFNKIDLVDDPRLAPRLRRRFERPLFLSAVTGEGLGLLQERLAEELQDEIVQMTLSIPHSRYELVAKLHRSGHIHRQKATDDGLEIEAAVPFDLVGPLSEFRVREPE